ncbi:glycosyltransferase family 2 protein [Turicibacter sanguinis]|uniref:glycosyltransferase family 2 protein n=1 Tax=Turicibacter sanguinis TaxID=154288 RepID=UPI00189C41DE|nr:glycosyltransferase family A protein [Turicibacter sanguinis]
MARISIIVPIYNVEAYLPTCLDSLVSQTYKDIEIICIDDGSTDKSSIILDSYVSRYPYLIRAFTILNKGLSGARNEGLKYATGEYICFIDSDDWLDIDLIENWMQVATKEQCDIVICGIQVVNKKGHILYKYGYLEGDLTPPRVSLETNEACNKLYHRSLFEGVLFPEGRWYEDLSLIPTLLTRAKSIGQVSQYGYYYLQRDGAITKTYDKRVLDICLAFDDIIRENNWSQQEYTRLFVKHAVYTLIRVGSISSRVQRYELYQSFYEYTQKVNSLLLFKKLSRQEGKNAMLLITLFIKRHWYLLDTILQIEIKLRRSWGYLQNNILE